MYKIELPKELKEMDFSSFSDIELVDKINAAWNAGDFMMVIRIKSSLDNRGIPLIFYIEGSHD